MAKVHKVHWGKDAWKKDILLLTCILRLRVQPSVPYHEIANFFLRTLSALMVHLANKVVPDEIRPTFMGKGMKEWLVGYLKEDFNAAEFWESQTWLKARETDEAVVREMLRIAGFGEMGYVLADEEEMELQIRWRRDGDWKAGSVPEGRTMVGSVQKSMGGKRFDGMTHRSLAELPESPVLSRQRRLTVGAENPQRLASRNTPNMQTFAEQLEELKHVQNALPRDDAPQIPLTTSGPTLKTKDGLTWEC
jgi:hypothetical protein